MTRFDDRAEAVARDKPSKAEVKAVRRALGTNWRRLRDDLASLDVLLHLGDNPNAPVEQGPPLYGSREYSEAIRFFGRVADDLRAIRKAIDKADFDRGDKRKIADGLGRLAGAWELRAKAYGSRNPNVMAERLREARALERESIAGRKALRPYLHKDDED